LRAANFEYVKFGAVAEVSIPEKTASMIQNMEIGLVNDALKKIYAQAETAGQPIALVNVVLDVSKRTTVESSMIPGGGNNVSVYDDYLVIRADIVKFTGPVAKSEGVYDDSEASKKLLAARVHDELRDRGLGASN